MAATQRNGGLKSLAERVNKKEGKTKWKILPLSKYMKTRECGNSDFIKIYENETDITKINGNEGDTKMREFCLYQNKREPEVAVVRGG